MSQEQLGRKVERSKSVISSYENNIKVPPLSILTQMAVIFNVSLDYLVGIDKNEMISVGGLSDGQKQLLQMIIAEFKTTRRKFEGLSVHQQEILTALLREFSKEK